jgi:hypothetical protein
MALVDAAKRTDAFVTEVEALRERWKTLMSAGRTKGEEKTPLWEYYSLVAQALSSLGGEANRGQIIDWVGNSGLGRLKPGDLAKTARGSSFGHHITTHRHPNTCIETSEE